MSDLPSLVAGLRSLVGSDGHLRLLAIGWATVDLERTAASMDALRFEAAPPESLVGATALRAAAGAFELILLEPSSEGKLAAALARRGEGIAALYLGVETLDGVGRRTALGRRGRLAPQGATWGPYLILVEDALPDVEIGSVATSVRGAPAHRVRAVRPRVAGQ